MTVKYKKLGLVAVLLGLALMLKADGPNQDQWASMEYMQWKFSPKPYYYSKYYERVLGVKIPIWSPIGLHDNGPFNLGVGGDHYVRQRWRQMSGLRIEAVSMAKMEEEQRDKIKNRWDAIMKRDALEFADKSVDTGKLIEDDKRSKLSSQITQMAEELPTNESLNIMDEYERIRQNIQIIHDAFIPNADKIIAYRKQMHKLERLNKITRMIYMMRDAEKIMHPERDAMFNDDWLDLN